MARQFRSPRVTSILILGLVLVGSLASPTPGRAADLPAKGTEILWDRYGVPHIFAPDHQSLDGYQDYVVKTFYYLPTLTDPFTTVVRLRGGRIANLQRIRRF